MAALNQLRNTLTTLAKLSLVGVIALLNGGLLTWSGVLGFVLLHIGTNPNTYHNYSDITLYFYGYGIVLALSIIGLVPPTDYWLSRVFLGVRPATNTEQAMLQPLIDTALKAVNHLNGGYTLAGVKCMISPSKEISISPFGRNSIIMTRGFLKNATSAEMQALLAHAIEQLHARDGLLLAILIFSSLATKATMWVFSQLIKIGRWLIQALAKISELFSVVGYLVLAALPPLILANYLIRHLLNFTLKFLLSQCIYRADQFVVTLGYKDALLSYLAKIDVLDNPDQSLFGQIVSCNPPVAIRIDKIK